MGDRANIFVVDQPSTPANDDAPVRGIYLYTHWEGYNWPEKLRAALDSGIARSRWDDPPYLTRIVVSEMFDDLRGGSTGGGISTVLEDNERPITILDIPNGTVAWAAEKEEVDRNEWHGHTSFDDFTAQERAEYP